MYVNKSSIVGKDYKEIFGVRELEDSIDIARAVFNSMNMEYVHFPFRESMSNGYLVIREKATWVGILILFFFFPLVVMLLMCFAVSKSCREHFKDWDKSVYFEPEMERLRDDFIIT